MEARISLDASLYEKTQPFTSRSAAGTSVSLGLNFRLVLPTSSLVSTLCGLVNSHGGSDRPNSSTQPAARKKKKLPHPARSDTRPLVWELGKGHRGVHPEMIDDAPGIRIQVPIDIELAGLIELLAAGAQSLGHSFSEQEEPEPTFPTLACAAGTKKYVMGDWFLPSCADASVLASSSATDGRVESGLVFQDETPVVTLRWGEQAYLLDVNEFDGGTRYKVKLLGDKTVKWVPQEDCYVDPSMHSGKCPQDSASWVDTPPALSEDGWNEQPRLSQEPIRARAIQTAETTIQAPAAERPSGQSRTRERPTPRPRILNKRLSPSSLPTSSAMERRESAQGLAESRGDVDQLTLPAMHGPSSASGVAQEHVGSPRETGGKELD